MCDEVINQNARLDQLSLIQVATKIAWSYLGTPYIWGGDDPVLGFDCSGFCIELLKSVGKLPRSGDWTAQELCYQIFDHSIKSSFDPYEGCLVFWHSNNSRDRIIHVEYCLNKKLSIGASGGGSNNETVQDAIEKNAYIKIRPFRSRKNIYGFVDPFKEDR